MTRAAPFFLACALACQSPPAPVALDLGPDEVAILSIHDRDGVLKSASFTTLSNGPLRLRFDEGSRLYAWRLSRSQQLATLDGTPSDDLLARVRLRIGQDLQPPDAALGFTPSDAVGACGRCLAPFARAPMLLLPGQSCPLPAFLEPVPISGTGASPTDAESAAWRAAIHLELPGDCACTTATIATAATPEISVIAPTIDGWPMQAIAVADDGTLALFSQDRAAVIGPAPQGARIDAAKLGLKGDVFAAGVLSDGEFLVASDSHQDTGSSDPNFTIFAADLESSRTLQTNPLQPQAFHRAPPDPLLYLLIGTPRDHAHAIVACRPGAALDCPPVTPSDSVPIGTNADLLAMSDSGLIATGGPGLIALGTRDSTIACGASLQSGGLGFRWNVDPSAVFPGACRDDPSRCAGETDPDFSTLLVIAWAEDQLFACGRMQAGPLVVLSRTASAGAVCGRPSEGWTVAWSDPAFQRARGREGCRDLLPLASADGPRIRLRFDDRGDIELHRTLAGAVEVDESPPALAGLEGQQITGLQNPVAGYSVALAGNRVFRRREQLGERFERVYGAPEAPDLGRWWGPVVARGDSVYVFGDRGRVEWLELGPAGLRSQHAGSLPGLESCPAPSAGALERRSGDILLAGIATSTACAAQVGLPWLYRAGSNQRIAISSSTALALGMIGAVPVGLAETSNESFVLLYGNRIARLEDGRLSEIPIQWDDPDTLVEETPPVETLPCPPRTERMAQVDSLWRALDADNGVAWAVGCEDSVVRIGPRQAQRLSMGRAPAPILATMPHELTAVRALCADHALLAAPGQSFLYDQGLAFEISAPSGSWSVGAWSEYRVPHANSGVGVPSAIVGGAGGVLVLFNQAEYLGVSSLPSGSIAASGATAWTKFGLGLNDAAQSQSGAVVVTADQGRLLLLRPAR